MFAEYRIHIGHFESLYKYIHTCFFSFFFMYEFKYYFLRPEMGTHSISVRLGDAEWAWVEVMRELRHTFSNFIEFFHTKNFSRVKVWGDLPKSLGLFLVFLPRTKGNNPRLFGVF